MPSRKRKTVTACAVTSLVLLVGLLVCAVIYVALSWQDIVGEDLPYELNDDTDEDCTSKATVVPDEAIMQMWDSSTNFSQAWRNAEQKAREPSHDYIKKHHSIVIYMYTNMILQHVKPDPDTAESARIQPKETFESRSLYFSLSEAIQILKHSQVTCLTTNYRTETLLNLNVSNRLIRFSAFMLGSGRWNLTGSASCFEVHTCFGADVTHYSAWKQESQVLIPPYEVFRVTGIETDAQRCEVFYRLKSDLNCVYDRESNTLHPISALPVDGFWVIFSITCMIIVSLSLPCLIVKVLENNKKTAVHSAVSLHNDTYSPATAVI